MLPKSAAWKREWRGTLPEWRGDCVNECVKGDLECVVRRRAEQKKSVPAKSRTQRNVDPKEESIPEKSPCQRNVHAARKKPIEEKSMRKERRPGDVASQACLTLPQEP
ncbi:hypothetical protein C8Q78DRAFT_1011706 [Trametes maxima]|nr:hypothetical protein C8Q78DRAFT_1011706 [Trametes maxima]